MSIINLKITVFVCFLANIVQAGPLSISLGDTSPLIFERDLHNNSKILNISAYKEENNFVVLKIIANTSLQKYQIINNIKPANITINLKDIKPVSSLGETIDAFPLGVIKIKKALNKTKVTLDLFGDKIPFYSSYHVKYDSGKYGLELLFPLKKYQKANQSDPIKELSELDLKIKDDYIEIDKIKETISIVNEKPLNITKVQKLKTSKNAEHIDINFQNADIRNVLKFIGDIGNVNIVFGDDVSGVVSIHLKDVFWKDALEAILQIKGMNYYESANIVRVISAQVLKQDQEFLAAENMLKNDSQLLLTKILTIKYASAANIMRELESVLSKKGTISHNKRTNKIIITDFQPIIGKAQAILKELDVRIPQIVLEAKIVEATSDFVQSLGIQWGGSIGKSTGSTNSSNYAVNLPASPATSAIDFSLGAIGQLTKLNARLSAAESDGRVNIISMPKIMTLDNKSAKITQGYKIPVTVNSLNSVHTEIINAALELVATPRVMPNGLIEMRVFITHNKPDFTKKNSFGIPAILTKEAKTQLIVKNGETIAVGGIYSNSTQEISQNTPFLSKIPIVNLLFKNKEQNAKKSEMLIFLTPKIIYPQAQKMVKEEISIKEEIVIGAGS